MQRKIIVIILFILPFIHLSAGTLTVQSVINWDISTWVLTIENDLPVSDMTLPSRKSQAEEYIRKDLKNIIFTGIQPLVLNSRTTVKEYISQHPEVIEDIYNLSDKAHRDFALLSKDMKKIKIQYTIALYPYIVEIFSNNQHPLPLDTLLIFSPSTDFSGIVIYVKKSLHLFGKNRFGHYVPALFPRVFNEQMDLIVDKAFVSPEVINTWGMVGFRTDLNLTESTKRIGMNPIKIVARGLFGINNTDIIIPDSEALKILSRKHNIELVKKGRILIVYVP